MDMAVAYLGTRNGSAQRAVGPLTSFNMWRHLLRTLICISAIHLAVAQNSLTSSADCGITTKRVGTVNRVVGGFEAAKGSWPWIAALLDEGELFCGGSLINNQLVLTAMHCFSERKEEDITVRLGEHDFKNSSAEAVELAIDRVFRHAQYKPTTAENDIALVKLRGTVTFNDYIRPICLPPSSLVLTDQPAHVAGWGNTKFGGVTSDVLREVVLSFWDFPMCRSLLDRRVPLKDDRQLCAGFAPGGKDSCQGDSGGPIALENEEGKWILAGIVSFGIGCARPNTPGIYTRVSHYLDWIAKQYLPPRCGTSVKTRTGSRRKRVIGGVAATEGQWPWIASLIRDGKHFCAGVLITDQHVLTAATCIIRSRGERVKPSDLIVRLGEHNFQQRSNVEKDFNVLSIVTHEAFARNPTPVNDIAIIKLTTKVEFSDHVVNICLTPTGEMIEETNAFFAGFGVTVFRGPENGALNHVELPVWKEDECLKAYEGFPLDEKMICAGLPAGGRGHCQGDVGGPLMKEFRKDRWTLIGIASFSKECALPNFPGVFTRVESYWDWIKANSV